MMQDQGFDSDASDGYSNESSGSTSSSSSSGESTTINKNEVVLYNNETFTFPRNIIENPMIFKEFFSLETWKSLPENYRSYLKQKFLPVFPTNNSSEQEKTIHMLFSNNIKRFNVNSFIDIYRQLEEGNFRPEISNIRKSIAKSRRREQRFKEYERISQLSKYLMIAREKLLCNAYNRPLGSRRIKSFKSSKNLSEFRLSSTLTAIKAKRRYSSEVKKIADMFNIKDMSDDENICDNPTENNNELEDFEVVDSNEIRILKTTHNKKRSNVLESSSVLLNSSTLKEALLEHKRRKLENPDRPEMDINDIRLRDIYTRTQISFEVKKNPLGSTKNLKGSSSDLLKSLTNPPQTMKSLVQQQQEPKYFAFSESEDDDIINSKKNPSLNDTCYNPVQKSQNSSSPSISATCDETKDFEMKRDSVAMQQYQGKVCAATVSDLEGIDMMGLPVDLDDSCDLDLYSELNNVADQSVIIKNHPTTQTAQNAMSAAIPNNSSPLLQNAKLSVVKPLQCNKGLNQETHSCFLSLIRDIFCSTPNHRMKMEELKEKVNIWSRGPIAALNEWYSQSDSWYSLVPSAINFLTGEYFEPHDDFVPYIEYKINLNIYQWIGAGRDTDNHLLALCKKWLVKKSISDKVDSKVGKFDVKDVFQESTNIPPPRSQTNWKVRPATAEEKLEFQSQERLRFEQAHKAFTYRQYGYESIVGPVKGIYAPISNLSKARNINRLTGNRPNYITVLTLVRDATARLPNGEGTKNDICELLKSSQYINLEANEKELHSIVSGALDRMLTEKPPCVKFDETRKLWIYMHRNKSESEFDFLHNQNQLKSVLNRKPNQTKKIKSTLKPPASVNRSVTNTANYSNQSLLKSGVTDGESPQKKYVQIHKSPVQKIIMAQSPNTVNLKPHNVQSQKVKVVTTSGIQTVNVSSASSSSSSTTNPQLLPISNSANQMKPILISTNTSTSQSQQSFILPVISNSLVENQQQIKVISAVPNTIIANSNILGSKFMKATSSPSSIGVRTVNTSTSNQAPSTLPRNIVRITNSNVNDPKHKVVSIQQNQTLQQQNKTSIIRPAVTKTISIMKSSVAPSAIHAPQKIQNNQINKKIISLNDLQQQKNVIIQQAVQGGQLIHKIINVAPSNSTSQQTSNILNPQIIQIQPSNTISSKNIQAINISQAGLKSGNISIGKQQGLNIEKGNLTNIRTMTVSNKTQSPKQIIQTNTINKNIKPTTHIRQTQTISPQQLMLTSNNSSQIITLDGLIQKQAVSTGQSVRIPTSSINISKPGQQSGSATNLIQISSSSAQGQVTQYAVVSGTTTSTTLHKVQNTSTTSQTTQIVPKIIQTIGGQQLFNTKVIAKSGTSNISPVNTIRMSNLNLSNLKIIASTNNSKLTATSTTTSSSTNQVFLQNSNVLFNSQGMKIQGNVLSSGNVQIIDQSVPRTTTTVLSPSVTTTVASSNAGTITVNTANFNSPRTVVLGPSSQGQSIKTIAQGSQQTSLNSGQHVILGNAVKGSQIKTAGGQQRIVLAVQGSGGQILLPQHFQGGTLNLKSIQGLKVVSLSGNNSGNTIQQQQQQQQKK